MHSFHIFYSLKKESCEISLLPLRCFSIYSHLQSAVFGSEVYILAETIFSFGIWNKFVKAYIRKHNL